MDLLLFGGIAWTNGHQKVVAAAAFVVCCAALAVSS